MIGYACKMDGKLCFPVVGSMDAAKEVAQQIAGRIIADEGVLTARIEIVGVSVSEC